MNFSNNSAFKIFFMTGFIFSINNVLTADNVLTITPGTVIPSNIEVGASNPIGQTVPSAFNAGEATGANNAIVSVSGVSINEPAGGQVRNGIGVSTTGSGGATVTVVDTIINNMKTTGPSLGINSIVASANSSSTASAILNMSGTNSVTVGQFDPVTGQPTVSGSGGGILNNNRGNGNSITTITGILNVRVNAIANSPDPARDDGVETTVRGGTATLDMTGLTGSSSVFVNGGNGLFIDSLPSTPNTTGGNVVVVGVSPLLTITEDNSFFGVANPITITPVSNSGIMAGTFGTGTVNVQGTSATINTVGPLADGLRGISQLGTVSLNNSGTITTSGPTSQGIEATTTHTGYDSLGIIWITGIPAVNTALPTGAVSVTNNGTITTTGGGSATTASNGIYAWTQSTGTGSSGDVTIANNLGGNIATTGAFSNAILANTTNTSGGPVGAISVANAAELLTTGASANGIAATTTKGPIGIANSGSVISQQADGILTTATTVGATLALSNSGDISGVNGIGISNNFINAQIGNTGTIGASTDLAINSSSLATGPLTIDNIGEITGYMTLGSGVNTLNNSGTWNLRNFSDTAGSFDPSGAPIRDTLGVAVANFGSSGTNLINNTGTVALFGSSGLPVTTLNTTGQYLPKGNPNNAMAIDGPVQGQILGVKTFVNSGLIDLTANPVPGDVLVITAGQTAGLDGGGVFITNGGTLMLDTLLNQGDVSSLSDVLVVDSTSLGTAPTGIAVVPAAASSGALTQGDGILLVEVLNKGASADGTFVLDGRVASGAYEYELFHNGVGADSADGNWYLRNSLPVPPAPPIPPGPVIPNYRVEVPVDMIVPTLAGRLGLAMIGTYHDRVGEDYPYQSVDCSCCVPCVNECECVQEKGEFAGWIRGFGESGSVHFSHGNSLLDRFKTFQKNGPSYNFNFGGLQVGADLYRGYNANCTRDIAGVYVGYGRIESCVDAVLGSRAGKTSMNAYSYGAYWTHKGNESNCNRGWYVDAAAEGIVYCGVRAHSVLGQTIKPSGSGFNASLETGYPIALGNCFAIEPQAQFIYQHVSFDHSKDSFGRIHFRDTDNSYLRAGGRLIKVIMLDNCQAITLWARASLWHTIGESSKTTFSSLAGLNPVRLKTKLNRNWGQFGLGASGQITQRISIFASGDYNRGIDRGRRWSWAGRTGFKVIW